jgi:hypothetical protein
LRRSVETISYEALGFTIDDKIASASLTHTHTGKTEMKKLRTAGLMLILMMLLSAAQPTLFAEDATQKTKLPKVLIIGDSISIGYTAHVIKALEGKAAVQRHKGNAGPTMRGLVHIDQWLGDTKWDVIHFNWGLWDMYGWAYAKEDRSPAMYEKRLRKLVARLKKTGAILIWGTTTPACPDAEKTMLKRFKTRTVFTPAAEKAYLDAALRVMKENKIRVNDLHAFIKPELKKYAVATDNVHYTKEGSKKLGKQVANSIEKTLKVEHTNSSNKK